MEMFYPSIFYSIGHGVKAIFVREKVIIREIEQIGFAADRRRLESGATGRQFLIKGVKSLFVFCHFYKTKETLTNHYPKKRN